jgi:hypothetical protein
LTKFKGPFAGIRESLTYARYIKFYHYPESGIIEMVVDGQAIIFAEIIHGMKKSGYKLESIYPRIPPELIDYIEDFQSDILDIEDEDDVPAFICLNMRFKDTALPPVENSRKNYLEKLRMKTVEPEFEAAIRESARSSCEVDTDCHHQEDDVIEGEDIEDGLGGL